MLIGLIFVQNEIPKLEKLSISSMKNLNDVWPCEITSSQEVNVSMLREITMKNCDSLVNLFQNNSLQFLQHLKDLYVDNCGSIEVLFNMDFGCVDGNDKGSSKLRRISIQNSEKLKEIWRIKGVNNFHFIDSFQAVEYIYINKCKSFRNVVTPTTAKFDLGALTNYTIDLVKIWKEVGQSKNGLKGDKRYVSCIILTFNFYLIIFCLLICGKFF